MTSALRNLPAYLQVASMGVQVVYAYRANVFLHLLSILLQVYLLKVVWTAIYAGRGSVDGIPLDALIVYLTLASLQMWILWPFVANELHFRVREGKIAQDLARPAGLLGQLLAGQVGVTAGFLPFVVLTLPLAFVVGGIRPPASAGAAVLYLVSLLLAYLVVVLMGLLLGLIAFWTLEITGIFAIYRFVNQFFAGALVPLWFLPPALRTVAEILPFQTQAFIPLSIYLGRVAGPDLIRALGVQLFWVVALYVVARLVWRRAMRRVVIQGG